MNHKGIGRCDMLLDLTPQEATGLRAKAGAFGLRLPAPAAANRRIYFLAVNHRKAALANPAFRRALAYAIDRDTLLDDNFRTGSEPKLHTPLNGPYPPQSWACNPDLIQKNGDKSTIDPFSVEKAKTNLALAGKDGVHEPELELKYPAGDAAVEKAMNELCKQVQSNLHVTLKAKPLEPAELRHDVETTYAYDLAYYHYDFPDDVYWLGPLLDPRGGPAGQNYLGYPREGSGGLILLMRDISHSRDFPPVQKFTHILHDKFLNEEMPFIPLWQLDALVGRQQSRGDSEGGLAV